ncbi:MAG: relaxase/mobilization nuclease domain-containing protein, partial [Armatimonadota bacterium]
MTVTIGTGGTFCRFTVGSSSPQSSVRYLRYIAQEASVREREQGTLLWNLPQRGPSGSQGAYSYRALTDALADYAKADARWEQAHHQSRGESRTHYRVLLSFEENPGTARANGLVAQWLAEAFPKARAAAFQHSNTDHLHTHIWIAARQTDGRKINLSARDFRQLDEKWNRLYSAALGRPERTHLDRKWQTEGYKMQRREDRGEGVEVPSVRRPSVRPTRAADDWNPRMFTDRERSRLEMSEQVYERYEGGVGPHQWAASGEYSTSSPGESGHGKGDPARSRGEPAIERNAERLNGAYRADDRAVSEVDRLREALARLGEQERELKVEQPALAKD